MFINNGHDINFFDYMKLFPALNFLNQVNTCLSPPPSQKDRKILRICVCVCFLDDRKQNYFMFDFKDIRAFDRPFRPPTEFLMLFYERVFSRF